MAKNPTSKLAGEARASYQKVAAQQAEGVGQKERAVGRQQQQVTQAAGMMQQQAGMQQQAEQQQAQLETRERIATAGQEQQQQQFESRQEQQQAQFQEGQDLRVAQFRDQQAQDAGRMGLAQQKQTETEKYREQSIDIEERKLAAATAKTRQAQAQQLEEKVQARRDGYQKRRDTLRASKERLFRAQTSGDLTGLAQMIAGTKAGENANVQQALKNLGGDSASPQDAQTLVQAIDGEIVHSLVNQAGELGEWNPPAHLADNPEVQQFNAFIVQSKMALNKQFQDALLGLSDDPRRYAELMRLQGSPEVRDRRIIRTAHKTMERFYRARQMRAGVLQMQQQGMDVQQQ